jgi:cellulose synthase/poly-beta-1,6-N-acetylglucosamine synthase-like glycosyltransferase
MAEIILTCIAAALCIPVAMFCIEVLLSLIPWRQRAFAELPPNSRVAILIPAHNEQAVIEATLQTLVPTLPVLARVVVVADNCSDCTASIARSLGADVVERFDSIRRGKGFALDHGIRHLQADPPDAVVFLDADCRVAPDTVRLLAGAAIASQRPVQGLNLCDPDPHGPPFQLISGLAFRFKNLVRTLGLVRLAGLNHLMGTGMALPWSLVERIKLADGNVVEDMQLGIDLALAGKPAMFVPAARVDSPLPQERNAAHTQRTRWEHGHLKTLLVQSPRLAWLAVRKGRFNLLCLALDLAIPPLSLLVMILLSGVLITGLLWLAFGITGPLLITSVAVVALAIGVLIGWSVHCRQQVPCSALFAAPLYALLKLPIYAAFLWKRQQTWIRTERDAGRTTATSRY